ncbi:Asp23/Gls24 family envelope stress response protein [Anoxybacterium hadale]|uniref:Asp23/Gls24 family envelope stress response protein n=1 Tax=Anoxybacterium hadale TaxID=3408580 RepID=A0ACD1ACK2_9FIRM|nr:Asp23/Gls24 family envelope stress response protein [Clostridiales bacterium]
MNVYGLVGKSGTGKSYQAMNLCRAMNIESFIDDGLFICGNAILEGVSAKRQNTKIAAIKTALFTDEEHRKAVAQKLKETAPASLLILGTSEKMIYRIAERLELPVPEKIVRIEQITTDEERATARTQRQELGKHIIPVPTFQLKREFSGYFLDPLRIIRGWRGGKASISERTVVRPTYSYLGDYAISDKVIGDVVYYIGKKMAGVDSVTKVSIENNAEGLKITIYLICKFGVRIVDVAKELQRTVVKMVETMTAFHIRAVDIEIKGLR